MSWPSRETGFHSAGRPYDDRSRPHPRFDRSRSPHQHYPSSSRGSGPPPTFEFSHGRPYQNYNMYDPHRKLNPRQDPLEHYPQSSERKHTNHRRGNRQFQRGNPPQRKNDYHVSASNESADLRDPIPSTSNRKEESANHESDNSDQDDDDELHFATGDFDEHQCPLCSFSVPDDDQADVSVRDQMFKHLKTVHPPQPAQDERFHCMYPKCSFQSKRGKRGQLIRHIRIGHFPSENFVCSNCERPFADERAFVNHRSKPCVPRSGGAFKCQWCSFTVRKKKALKLHQRAFHHLTCRICFQDIIYRTIDAYIEHVNLDHQDILHQETERSIQLTKISYIHPDIHKCNVCDKLFSTDAALNGHNRSQHRKCRVCDYTTIKVNKMSHHESNDHYKCSICSSVFLKQCILDGHRALCNLKCNLCGVTSISHTLLQTHQDIVHSIDGPFICCACRLRFSTSNDLENHGCEFLKRI